MEDTRRESVRVGPHRRYPGTIQGDRAAHGGRGALYAEGLDQVQRLADARRTRLVAAEESACHPVGCSDRCGVVVVGFAYLFGMENTGRTR